MNPKDGNHAWAHEWRPWLEAINIKAMGGAQDEGRGWKLWMKAMDQNPNGGLDGDHGSMWFHGCHGAISKSWNRFVCCAGLVVYVERLGMDFEKPRNGS